MRFLVTGGCGFVGSAVVRALMAASDAGHQVLNIDRRMRSAATPQLAGLSGKPGYARLEANVADRSLMRAVMAQFKPDAVIHLAGAPNPEQQFDAELAGAFSMMEAVRALPNAADVRFVHAIAQPFAGITEPAARSALKDASLSLLSGWAEAHTLKLVTCRCGALFGPFQSEVALIPSLVDRLLRGETVSLPSDGGAVGDWLHVTDFAQGLVRAAEAGERAIYDFSAAADRSMAEIAESVAVVLDVRQLRADGVSYGAQIRLDAPDSADSEVTLLDPTRSEQDLGWSSAGFLARLDRTVADLAKLTLSRLAQQPAAIAA